MNENDVMTDYERNLFTTVWWSLLETETQRLWQAREAMDESMRNAETGGDYIMWLGIYHTRLRNIMRLMYRGANHRDWPWLIEELEQSQDLNEDVETLIAKLMNWAIGREVRQDI